MLGLVHRLEGSFRHDVDHRSPRPHCLRHYGLAAHDALGSLEHFVGVLVGNEGHAAAVSQHKIPGSNLHTGTGSTC